MKKLMFALAIAMVAGIAQAATLQWGTNLSKTAGLTDGSGNLLTSAPDFNVVLVNVTGLTQDKWVSDGTVADTASFTYNASKGQKITGTLNATVTADGTATDKAYWNSQVYAVMVEKGGNLGYLMNGDTPVTTTFSPAVSDNSSALTSGYTLSTANYKAGAIAPEPTSGILMLVGLGALALRRRKA